MAKEAPVSDPLNWLQESLEKELSPVSASVEHQYSSSDRGSLTVNREGKVMQTSYFSSWEIQALREGGVPALEKQKAAIIEQINRLLNPPKPQPISLNVTPLKRGRGAKKPEAPAAAAESTEAAEGGEEAAEAPETPETPETAAAEEE